MYKYIEQLRLSTETLKDKIVHHPAYTAIRGLADLKVFMEHHIYAVWDFMSLLKALQAKLTSVSIPWFPIGSPDVRYLINEIVTGEESDIDENGKRYSHFELYIDAMKQCGADTEIVAGFLEKVKAGTTIQQAAFESGVPQKALDFMNFTFSVIATGKPHVIAAVFTFGREDLIPNMFHTIVGDIHERFPGQVSIFKYYLDRHIEVDGEHHGKLALQMVSELCGDDEDKWGEAITYTYKALESRIQLWDGVLEEINE